MSVDIQKKYLGRAYFVVKVLQLVPFLRMIGLNGSLARGEASKESDIDFLVITKAGRIWTTRFFMVLLTQLTGFRRHGEKIAGRICLNRYQTDDFLEILPHDSYHGRVFSVLVPIFNKAATYKNYVNANRWMEQAGFKVKQGIEIRPLKNSAIFGYIQKFGEMLLGGKFGNFIEKKLKKYQEKRILKNPITHSSPEGRVRISDKELCFHPPKK